MVRIWCACDVPFTPPPLPLPLPLQGIFAMMRSYFIELGEYDEGTE